MDNLLHFTHTTTTTSSSSKKGTNQLHQQPLVRVSCYCHLCPTAWAEPLFSHWEAQVVSKQPPRKGTCGTTSSKFKWSNLHSSGTNMKWIMAPWKTISHTNRWLSTSMLVPGRVIENAWSCYEKWTKCMVSRDDPRHWFCQTFWLMLLTNIRMLEPFSWM